MPSSPRREGGPADDLATGGAVALGVAQGAPAGVDEEERDEPADLADRARRSPSGRSPSLRRAAATTRRRRRPWRGRRGTGRRRRGGARGRGRGPTARSTARPRRRRGRCRATRLRHHARARRRLRATGPGPLRTARGAGRARRTALGRAGAAPALEERRGRGACWYSVIGCSNPWWCAWIQTCSSSATPAGKTYGSPCVRPYGHVTPVTWTTGVRVVRGQAAATGGERAADPAPDGQIPTRGSS